jgi:phenylalanyl-tRNA synthetase beta chain
MLAVWLTGDEKSENWHDKPKPISFFSMKTWVNAVFNKLGIKDRISITKEAPADLFEYGLTLSIGKQQVGFMGLVASKICESLDIKNEVFYAELKWDMLFDAAKRQKISLTEISKYPEVRRDLALLIDNSVNFDQLKNLAIETEKKLIKQINLFDVYQGSKLGENKKSYAISFVLQDENKTLTDKQIDKVMNNLIRVFGEKLGAQVR